MTLARQAGEPLTASVVLPVHNQADHIASVVESYLEIIRPFNMQIDLVLVTNACTDASAEICRALAERHREVHALEHADGGWGRAVRAGLAAASGDLVGYANSARTSPQILALMLSYAQAYPEVVLKANRKLRDKLVRRLGSLLYNLECRALFNLPTWDINGTPKLFPRSFQRLLELESEDDLIDVEFVLTCQREDYPIIEVPLLSAVRLGGKSTTNYHSAARMYLGALALHRRWRAGP